MGSPATSTSMDGIPAAVWGVVDLVSRELSAKKEELKELQETHQFVCAVCINYPRLVTAALTSTYRRTRFCVTRLRSSESRSLRYGRRKSKQRRILQMFLVMG